MRKTRALRNFVSDTFVWKISVIVEKCNGDDGDDCGYDCGGGDGEGGRPCLVDCCRKEESWLKVVVHHRQMPRSECLPTNHLGTFVYPEPPSTSVYHCLPLLIDR